MKAVVWLFGVMVCLLAAPRVQLFASAGNGWPHNVLRYYIRQLVKPAATACRDCKSVSGLGVYPYTKMPTHSVGGDRLYVFLGRVGYYNRNLCE